jgi:aspartate-semialdehyde dehydrogenase
MHKIAVLGVNTLVGRELVSILEQRDFPAKEIHFYDADAQEGEKVFFKGKVVELHSSYAGFLNDIELAFCCQDRIRARALITKFKKKSLVIDLSGAFRFAPDVLQVIPEINAQELAMQKGIIVNPSPATIQLVLPLFPLHERFKLKRLHVTSLNTVSDLGKDALDELNYEYEFLAVGETVTKAPDSVFPCTIGSNLIPQIGDFVHHGYTEEETLLAREVTEMLGQDEILVSATCIWVPVQRVNYAVVQADFEETVQCNEAKKVLKSAKGVKLMSHDEEYPTQDSVMGMDEVFVGRLRQDMAFQNGLTMWIAADNLRKGSALNAVQIAELV